MIYKSSNDLNDLNAIPGVPLDKIVLKAVNTYSSHMGFYHNSDSEHLAAQDFAYKIFNKIIYETIKPLDFTEFIKAKIKENPDAYSNFQSKVSKCFNSLRNKGEIYRTPKGVDFYGWTALSVN